ncbi:hypothetical protein HK405_014811, partial [Cladochytrium tenue]
MRNLRFFNATIADLANAAFYAIFALAETIGFRHLLRTHSLNVPFAMSASAVLVTVNYAAILNHLEMLWFAKPSSVSSRSHLQSLVVTLASTARTTGLSVSVSALTADGMTRRAFPHLPSLSHALSLSPFFATPRWRVRTILLDAAAKAGEAGKTVSEARTADRLRQRAEHVDARWDRHGRLQSFVHAVADDVAGAWVEEEDADGGGGGRDRWTTGGRRLPQRTGAVQGPRCCAQDLVPRSRRDWVVTVADGRYAGLLPLDAEVHHHIRVSNNTVAEWNSGLRLSDAYQHEAAAGRVVPQLLGTVAIALTTVGSLVALGTFLMQTASQRIHWRAFWTVFGLDLAAGVLSEVNGRSQFLINVSPTAPLTDQVLRKVVGAATTSVGTALVAGSCVAVTSPRSPSSAALPECAPRLHILANEDSAAVTAVVYILRSVPSMAVVGCVFQLITHWTQGWRPRHLVAAAATAALCSLTDIAATEDGRRVVSTHLHAVFVVVVKDVMLYLCYGFVFRHVIGDLRGSVAT